LREEVGEPGKGGREEGRDGERVNGCFLLAMQNESKGEAKKRGRKKI